MSTMVNQRQINERLTTSMSLDATMLTDGFPPSPWSMFQTLTTLSAPPVQIQPRSCELTSNADAAPSCAEIVNRAGDGDLRSVGNVRASKLSTRPFSSDTYFFVSIPKHFFMIE